MQTSGNLSGQKKRLESYFVPMPCIQETVTWVSLTASHNTKKVFSFRGLCPLTRDSAPGPCWGHSPQTSVLGSCSTLAINGPSPPQSLLLDPPLLLVSWGGVISPNAPPLLAPQAFSTFDLHAPRASLVSPWFRAGYGPVYRPIGST